MNADADARLVDTSMLDSSHNPTTITAVPAIGNGR